MSIDRAWLNSLLSENPNSYAHDVTFESASDVDSEVFLYMYPKISRLNTTIILAKEWKLSRNT